MPDVRETELVERCECGHRNGAHNPESGECEAEEPHDDGFWVRVCDCAAFRPRFPVPEEGGR